MAKKTSYNSHFYKMLTHYVTAAVLAVFVVIFTSSSIFLAITLKQRAEERHTAKVQLYVSKIEQEISTVEEKLEAYDMAMRRNIDSEEAVRGVLMDMMHDKRFMFSFICFKPDGEDRAMYEVIRNSTNSLPYFNKRPTGHKYETYPYYLLPYRLKKNYLTYPYPLHGEQVATMTHPLVNEKGEVFAVMGVDYRLNHLKHIISGLGRSRGEKAAVFSVFSSDGRYVIHSNRQMVENETFITDARMNNSPGLEEIGRRIQAGGSGVESIDYDGNKEVACFASVKAVNANWGVVMRVPFTEIYSTLFYGLLTSTVLLVICLVILYYVVRYVIIRKTRPISDYAEASVAIAQGDFDKPIRRMETGDEIQYLGDSLDEMRVALKDYMHKVAETTAAQRIMESELLIAHEVQMSMLPRVLPTYPSHKDIDVYAFMQPAKAVGGDLYDVMCRDEKLFFIIGDVSGKGIPASLVMAITASVFRASYRGGIAPNIVVENINNTLSPNNERNMFVTLIVGELDLSDGRLLFCNAGHDPMLIVREDEVVTVPMDSNLPVGVMERMPYTLNEAYLNPDDKLLLYTDGIAEAENTEKKLYTIERLVETAQTAVRLNAREMVDSVIEDVRRHADGAEQSDDITIMCVHYKPTGRMWKRIAFENDKNEVTRIAAIINDFCTSLSLTKDTILNIQLAVEEAMINIIDYAYPPNAESSNTLVLSAVSNRIDIILSDSGTPFDPTTFEIPDTAENADDASEGKLGIMLVMSMMNEVKYQRIDGRNELKMSKEIRKEK
ncbi:MAG: SpoIIE family protein phosphatase [Bacteroidaceae bacterium]|nr:SpoIIE family protein phosphatase [Bacteroidaceae bacterium]